MEKIVFVNEDGTPTGKTGSKLESHTSDTKLHAGFSCYVFNERGKFLVTKRASSKKVWPNVWTNSVCGHPAPGESTKDAIIRRLDFELGMKAKDFSVILPKYRYKTPPYNGIIENEFCPVYVAVATGEPQPNPEEVGNYKWVDWDWYVDQIQKDSNDYSNPTETNAPTWSYWCKDQLILLQKNKGFMKFVNSLK
jgi:isopentenyl-diphosphate Delta-isomerase